PAENATHRAFHSLFFLAQALGEKTTEEPKNLWIMSDGLAAVSQEDLPDPDKALLLGPCRTIPFEYPNLHCTMIDVGTAQSNVVSALLQYCADVPQSSLMAYRMRRMWNQYAEPLPIQPSDEAQSLRQGGVYLIADGLSVVGLTLALHLADKAKATLVLVGAASPAPRAEWEHLLAMD